MASEPSRPHAAVLIDYGGESGGAETLAVQLLERLNPARFGRTLVTYQRIAETDPLRESCANVITRLRACGVEVIELNRRDRYDLTAWRPLVRMLRAGEIDVLHSHKFGPNVWATSLARLGRVPVVIAHEHTWAFDGDRKRMFADRWLIATGCDVVLAVSELDRERMMRLEGIPAARVRCLPNGIPTPSALPDDSGVRRELGVPIDVPLIGAVGVLRAQKDYPTLVHAHAKLLERVPDAHLAIVGDGPDRAELERLIARLRVAERVRLVGNRNDAMRVASAFDVAVSSSLFEGSSLAVIEYMALGRPIVATRVGGTPDLLAQGDAGVLVPPGDPVALCTAIGDLLADGPRARALGERARRRQRDEYDLDVQVRRLELLYDELLASKAGASRPGRRR